MAGYGTDTDFTEWLESQGLTLPDDAPSEAALRQRGSDYIDATYEGNLMCSRRAGGYDQERAWPRSGHVAGGHSFPDDVIPPPWITASYRAAWLEATNPGWASGTIDPNRRTRREKADVLEREYFEPAGSGDGGVLGNVDAMIQGMVAGLFCSGRGLFFRVI